MAHFLFLLAFVNLNGIIIQGFVYNDKNVSKRLLASSPSNKGNRNGLCDKIPESHDRYFEDLQRLYSKTKIGDTCASQHLKCGWPIEKNENDLPLFVFIAGIEGSGHHLWNVILEGVLDCTWNSAPHYSGMKTVGPDGVMSETMTRYHGFPHLTSEEFARAIFEQYRTKTNHANERCRSILNSLDSFPFGLVANGRDSTQRDGHRGRAMNHADLINLQALDGVLFNVKYIVLARNLTDASISALSRRFLENIDELLRGVEMNLLYLESALRAIPCHKIFLAYFEQFQADPLSFLSPLQSFLELSSNKRELLKQNILLFQNDQNGRRREPYSFPPTICGKGVPHYACYRQLWKNFNIFYNSRHVMWPTFSGNGYELQRK